MPVLIGGRKHCLIVLGEIPNGWLAKLYFTRVMDLYEKQQIEGYLADKWEMQTEFPDEHPFKYHKPWVNLAWCLVVYQAKLGALKFRLPQPINGKYK